MGRSDALVGRTTVTRESEMNGLRKTVAGVIVATIAITGIFDGLAGAATPPAVPVPAKGARPAFGVQFHATWSNYTDAQRTAVLDSLAAAHVEWIRVDLGWSSFEEHGKGQISQWYAGMVDSVVDQAQARGIKVLGTLWLTPAWANGGQGTRVPPSNPADYADFARWAASRYQGRVSAWEVWNEPNQDTFWIGSDPVRYAALVKAAYPAFKAGDPRALVLAGSVAENDTTWLERMYAAGAGGSFDVLSTHPYQGPADAPPELPDDGNKWVLDHVGAVHRLMVAHGDEAKPIWGTEYGWSTHANGPSTPNWEKGVTEAQQADYLTRSLAFFGSKHPYVTNVFWYEERNEGTSSAHIDNYGLLRHDLSPKPAYYQLRQALSTTDPTPIPTPAPVAPGPDAGGPAPAPALPSTPPAPAHSEAGAESWPGAEADPGAEASSGPRSTLPPRARL